jgi:hypothetical protein
MKKDDLTQIKYVGAARMKLLNESGITTFKQLYKASLDEITRIAGFGAHYAKLIKDAAAEYYQPVSEPATPKKAAGKAKKAGALNENLQKQIKTMNKRLKRANENLKPLGEKKYLKPYIEFKKRSKMLKSRLKALELSQGDISKKDKKIIFKNAVALNSILKSSGKKPTKKNFKKVNREVQTFSNML